MPTFFYTAVSHSGEILKGKIEASDKEIAIAKLQNSGYFPINLSRSPRHTNLNLKKFTFKGNRSHSIRQRDITRLTRKFATLLQAGLPLDTAIETLIRLSSNTKMTMLLEGISQDVKNGSPLSKAIEKQSSQFSKLYISTIKAGETSGALELVIERLATYLEGVDTLHAHIISIMIYPVILLCTSLGSIFALMLYVVPQFIPLFSDVQQSLPFFTQTIFSIAIFLQHYWWLPCGLSAAGLWFIARLNKQEKYCMQRDRWLLDLPIIGELIIQLQFARYFRTLGILLKNGVAILSAVSIAQETMHNKHLSQVISEVKISLERGGKFSTPLSNSDIVPPLTVQFIDIGESTGDLEGMLDKLASIYEDESNNTIMRLVTLIEPALIISLGLIITGIIMSILLPILDLNDLII